ncbi:NAD-dependent epimerase/dehydratase family protein [Pseudonocardia saturnea]
MAGTAFVTGGSGFVGGHLVERLVRDGWAVRALARSDRAAERVAELGADPVRGDLHSTPAIRTGAAGADTAFHAAATVGEWGRRDAYLRGNVIGTENALRGCREAGVRRFVHVGTEAALMAGAPLVDVDETAPLRPDSPTPYAATKAMAEQLVRARNTDEFQTIVIRPRLVWGPRDATILPGILSAIEHGRFAWIGGGTHLTSTTHVANAVEGLVLAATRGRAGDAYFVTDGPPVVFRDFVTRLVATAGVDTPTRRMPVALADILTRISEPTWTALRLTSTPPLTRMALWLTAHECTIDISRAETELGYTPVISREQGLAELGLDE